MNKHGWTYKSLDEVCSINYGTRVVQKKDKGTTYYVYGGGGATFMIDRYNREDCFIVSRFAMSPKCTRFVKGKFFLNDSGLSVSTNSELLSQAFLDKSLFAYNDLIYSMGKGLAQRNLDMPSFKKLQIPIPPLAEQERIVEELDLLSGIIEKKKEQLKAYDQLAQSIFYDMFGDPIDNPKGWDVKSIGEMAAVKTGPFGSMLHKEDYVSNGIPLVNPIHMKDYKVIADMDFTITDEKAEELKNYILQENDVIFARRGDIGRCATITKNENGYLCGTGSLFVRFEIEISSCYVMYMIRSESFTNEITSKARGVTMLNINSNTISDLIIPVPPLYLQQQFAEKVEAIEKQKELIRQSIVETQTMFDFTMDKYFG